jgi:hypothetical protein
LRQRIYALPILRCTAKKEMCAVHCYAEFFPMQGCGASFIERKTLRPGAELRIT